MTEFCPQKCGVLHFVGIGGIGMSGIAEALATLGYMVQGSDASASYNTKRLQDMNVTVHIGHDAAHLTRDDGRDIVAVVVSTAIKPGNPELLEARRRKIPVVRRADMLAEIMRHKKCVAVAGTHGKTTTTSLVGAMFESADLDPTIINGGIIHAYGTNTRMGAGTWMVVEADESDGSFNRLPATIAVITNIDPEHVDYYGSFDGIRRAYRDFVHAVPFYGFAVLCADHPEVYQLARATTDRCVYTYGLDAVDADVRAVNVKTTRDGATFDVVFSGHVTGGTPEIVPGFTLPLMGMHNVQNALVPLTIARALNMPSAAMHDALKSFQGVKRRFTKTGEVGGVTVIDDYAHHPAEIRATLRAARQAVAGTDGRIICVMQPHRYSRLAHLFPEFCTAFDDADHVLIADVYAAGEQPVDGASRDALIDGIIAHGHASVNALNSAGVDNDAVARTLACLLTATADSVAEAHKKNNPPSAKGASFIPPLKPGDYILCLGAGSITYWAHALPDVLEQDQNNATLSQG